ncbi:MAG: DUF3052 domain-containing protein [Acidobacteriota bacterium]|nr:DUF3052 domain-containing protein [Acidobacteriota bacterium]
MAGYSQTPLPQKLGIKDGMSVALIDAPDGFMRLLGELPEGVRFSPAARKPGLTLWFVRSRRDHEKRLARILELAEHGHIWTIWPKLTSALASDISETYIRNVSLHAGLVDFKVCAVDDTWSGLKLAKRKPPVRTAVSRKP